MKECDLFHQDGSTTMIGKLQVKTPLSLTVGSILATQRDNVKISYSHKGVVIHVYLIAILNVNCT